MKKLFLSLVLLTVGTLAFSQQFRIIAEEPDPDYQDSAQPSKDLSGFSGYSWGASIEFIRHHMEDEEYFLVAATCTKLQYRGKVLDDHLVLVYGFENGILDSGIWIIDDVNYDSFWRVNEFLQEVYNVKTRPTLSAGFAEAEMFPRGTNAHIVHNLDIEDDRHEVHYYYRSGAE